MCRGQCPGSCTAGGGTHSKERPSRATGRSEAGLAPEEDTQASEGPHAMG